MRLSPCRNLSPPRPSLPPRQHSFTERREDKSHLERRGKEEGQRGVTLRPPSPPQNANRSSEVRALEMQDVVYFGVLADAHDFFPIERAQSNPDVRVRQVIEVRRESPAADGRASRQFSCYSFLSQFLAKRHHFCASECTYSCGHAAGKGGSAVTCDFPLVFRRARDERR